MADKPKKKTYTTVVVEKVVEVPRQRAWEAVGEQMRVVAASEPSFETLANEPPWRYVYRQTDPAAALVECTVTIRDDDTSCNLTWSAVIDPLEPTSATALVERFGNSFDTYVAAVVSFADAA